MVVLSEKELLAALRNQTVEHAHLGDNIRLTADAWPSNPVYRTTNLTISGRGASNTLIDFSFLAAKVTLAPGVVLRMVGLESRNARSGVGYGIDFLTASPGATVEFVNSTMFSFACLPLELLVPALLSYGRPAGSSLAGPASAARSAQTPLQELSTEAVWCRATPAIARCYNSCVGLVDMALPVAVYTGSTTGSQSGGYTVVAYNSTLVCESPVSAACGVQLGYEACVLARRQQLYEADDTWDRLAASRGGGGGGGGSGISGGQLAGAVVGAVAGAGLLLALLAAGVLWRRRLREGQYAAAKAPAPPPPLPAASPPVANGGGGGGGGAAGGNGGGGAAVRLMAAASARHDAPPGAAGQPERHAGTRQTGVSSGTAQECVRTFGEPYSQQNVDQYGEQLPDDYAEPYADQAAMQNVRTWLAAQQTTPPPPPPAEQDQAVWQSA